MTRLVSSARRLRRAWAAPPQRRNRNARSEAVGPAGQDHPALRAPTPAKSLGNTTLGFSRPAGSATALECPLRCRELPALLVAHLRITRARAIRARRSPPRRPRRAVNHLLSAGTTYQRFGGRGAPDRVLVGVHVVLPERPLLGVVRGELPVLLRVFATLEKAALLLVARDVQEEFPDETPLRAR